MHLLFLLAVVTCVLEKQCVTDYVVWFHVAHCQYGVQRRALVNMIMNFRIL
jgi:hypothetical protein